MLFLDIWYEVVMVVCVFLGGQAAERTADGNEGTQRDLHGSWTQQVSYKQISFLSTCLSGPSLISHILCYSGTSPQRLHLVDCVSEAFQ